MMKKKSKYQQYFHCFIVYVLFSYLFWFSYQWNMVTVLISAEFRGVALIKWGVYQREALISKWIPKGAALIRGRRLFETRHLLEEIRYLMYIAFRSQRGIGQVPKEMCFGKDVSLKFACLDAREGERLSIISEA